MLYTSNVKPGAVFCALLFSCPLLGDEPTHGAVYYFNNPESVKSPGVLGEATLPANEPARLFFHFVNKTGHAQPFSVVADANWNVSNSGFGLDADPGKAGREAVTHFLAGHHPAPAAIQVQPGQTVSGIMDCLPAASTHVICSMGTGPTHWNVQVANNPLEVQDTDLALGTVSLTFGKDSPGAVDGCYGTTVRLRFHNRTVKPVKATFSVSPRGGGLTFVYLFNGSVFMTNEIPARGHEQLFTTAVAPGGMIVLDTIPTGGYSYPVKISATVLQ